MSEASTVDDLLDRADAARAAGRGDVAARLYDEAIARCRSDGDLTVWTRGVLGAASVYVFGAEPGPLPAQLYDVLVRTTDDRDRARVAAALARCWVYAGQAARAVPFATEALDRAQRVGAPELVADCLDAALAAHWGPDELADRVALSRRLDEVTAHVLDPEARLRAHLWGLQVACEVLDIQAMHRHMRALERLGDESPTALFFAASRRLMLDLLRGRPDTAAQLVEVATEASGQAALADSWMVLEAMEGYAAVQSGATAVCARVASAAERWALSEGATTVCAEAAYIWLGAGELDRARRLLFTFHGPVLDELPRDVNFLLTLQCVLEVALAVDDRDAIEASARLLQPYTGRAVFNAGAVMFHGLVDDSVGRAAAILGDPETARRLQAAALATYERIGASWWRQRLEAWVPPEPAVPSPRGLRARMHPTVDGLWLVGWEPDPRPVRPLRGYRYLSELLRRPGQAVSALDLVTGGTGALVEHGHGEALDRRAIEAYRRRLSAIDHDLAEAEDWADRGRTEILAAEREALLHELGAATGLGGRARTGGSSQERARIAATKAIRAAIDRIAATDEGLGTHLRTSVRTGAHCLYQPPPDDQPVWVLDP